MAMPALLTTSAIAADLRAEWSRLPGGSRLPSDRAIAERYDVGRGVAAGIMADLEREGVVRRQRGAGSFWLGIAESVAPVTTASFTLNMRRAGVTPGFTMMAHETRRVAATERELLQLPANSLVWRIQRIFTVDDVAVGVATSVLPARDLTALPSEMEHYGSLFETLRRRYHVEPVRTWKRRRPTEAPRFVGEALGLRNPISFHLEESLNSSPEGTPIEYARTYMRADALSTDALIRRAHGRVPDRQEAHRR